MRPIRRIVLLVAAVLAATCPVASARGGDDGPRVVPSYDVGGNQGADLLGDWFAINLALPNSSAPFATDPDNRIDLCLRVGRGPGVVSPVGGRISPEGFTCYVRRGQPVFVVGPSADCSTNEPPPFFGATEAEQRECAVGWIGNFGLTAIDVTIDGGPPVSVFSPRFVTVSPQRRTVFNRDPVFDAKPGPARFVAAAWTWEIRGMERGRHTMAMTATTDAPQPVPYIVHFVVL